MQLSLDLNWKLRVALSPLRTLKEYAIQGGLPCMFEDWARMTFEKLTNEEKECRHLEELEVQRRNLVLADSPRKWHLLEDHLKNGAESLNKYYPKDRPYISVSKRPNMEGEHVRIKSPKADLMIFFKENIPVINFRVTKQADPSDDPQEREGELMFEVDNGKVWLKARDSELMSVQEATIYLLTTVMRISS